MNLRPLLLIIKDSIIEIESLALQLSACRALAKIANMVELELIKPHLPLFF